MSIRQNLDERIVKQKSFDLTTGSILLDDALRQAIYTGEIDSVYLYGSFSRGTANAQSDIDMIIISDSYSGISQYLRRRLFLFQYGQDANIKLDPVCMTKKEFEKYCRSEAYRQEKLVQLYEVT